MSRIIKFSSSLIFLSFLVFVGMEVVYSLKKKAPPKKPLPTKHVPPMKPLPPVPAGRRIEKLVEKQVEQKGRTIQDLESGPIDKTFIRAGESIAKKIPGISTKLMETSLKIHEKIKNTPLGRLSEKLGQTSQSFKNRLTHRIYSKALLKDEEIKKIEYDKFIDYFKSTYGKEKFDELVKKQIAIKEMKLEKMSDEAKLAVEREIISGMRDEFRDIEIREAEWKRVPDAKRSYLESRVKQLEGNPKEYEKFLEKIEEPSEKIKYALKSPEDPKNMEIVEKAIKRDIIEKAKRNAFGWLNDKSQKYRYAALTSPWGIIATLVILVTGQLLALLVKNSIGWATSALSPEEPGMREDFLPRGYVLDSRVPVGTTFEEEGISKENEKRANALIEVIRFYLLFDEKFKNALHQLDYYDNTFKIAEQLKYDGNSIPAGVIVLFNYSGLGNVADGVTPVFIKVYPMTFSEQMVSQEEIFKSIRSESVLELTGALMRSAPEVIFFVRCVSLLNTANKKFDNVDKRSNFLNDQLELLFIRFIRTVDDMATARANALEPDFDKWEPVYLKSLAKTLRSAPKVVRDVVEELSVEIKDEEGELKKISFEQYMMDRFDKFKEFEQIKFEGDIGYQSDSEKKFNSNELKQHFFALFLRALDYVLRVERLLITKTDPVIIRDAQGVERKIIGKKLYDEITGKVFKRLQQAQEKLVDAAVEFAADEKNAELRSEYQIRQKELASILPDWEKAVLKFRKKVSFYPFERTQGFEPERVLDFVKRECKRYYQQTEDKEGFAKILSQIFKPFDSNFPFSAQDLLKYSEEPGEIKPPVKKKF